MSRIVQLSGTFAERLATANALEEGLFFLASVSNTRFLTKRRWYPDRSESDVIVVKGLQRVMDLQPGEKAGEFISDGYWSADYIVVLDKPDTTLFNLTSKVPEYRAEAGQAHGCLVIVTIAIASLIVLAVSLLAGQGWWSVLWAFLVQAVVLAGFILEYPVKAWYAAVLGWWYVRDAIKKNRGTREHYLELVTHLSECDDPVARDVNKRILKLI
ncbi:MAG: hypothetical protein KBD06_03945 [Candidatus Pacebacteria bacterium]|nr:hypothetical protein [Candidatus Paceibacterota bacterium]